jgi:hypothetical protein
MYLIGLQNMWGVSKRPELRAVGHMVFDVPKVPPPMPPIKEIEPEPDV